MERCLSGMVRSGYLLPDNNTAYTAGTGINITRRSLITQEMRSSNDITNTTSATGDLSGTYPAPVGRYSGKTGCRSFAWNWSDIKVEWFAVVSFNDDGTNYTAGTGSILPEQPLITPEIQILQMILPIRLWDWEMCVRIISYLTVTGIQGKPGFLCRSTFQWTNIKWTEPMVVSCF
ncbi:MAG: hypothetical protein R3B93_22260 [Bacteroidia bacterium]